MVSLCSCATRPDRTFPMESRKQQAIELEKKKHLADALLQWQIVSAANPEDQDARQAIVRLESAIRARLDSIREQVKKPSPPEQLRILHLKTLALQPGNQEAIAALKKLEWTTADQAASDKSASMANWQRKPAISVPRNTPQVAPSPKASQTSSSTNLAQFNRLLDLAEQSLRDQRWEHAGELLLQASDLSQSDASGRLITMKKQLSQQYYALGMRVFTSNLEQAIDDLQTSLWFDPDNIKARIQLSRASKMKQNLEEIRNPK